MSRDFGKSEAFPIYKVFVSIYDGKPISYKHQNFPFDSGGEYISHDFLCFLEEKGIILQKSCPHTPQQNGITERKNQHILDVTRTLLLDASVALTFWDEIVRTMVFLINCQFSPILQNDSPYFHLFQKQPNLSTLHTFGCVCFVHLPLLERNKFSTQSVHYVF